MDNGDQPMNATQGPGRDQLLNAATSPSGKERPTLEDRIGQLHDVLNHLESDIDSLGSALEPVSIPTPQSEGMAKEVDEPESVYSAHVRQATNRANDLRAVVQNMRRQLDL